MLRRRVPPPATAPSAAAMACYGRMTCKVTGPSFPVPRAPMFEPRNTRYEPSVAFHFCADCGCITHYRALKADPEGRIRTAVNLRMAEPDVVAHLPSSIGKVCKLSPVSARTDAAPRICGSRQPPIPPGQTVTVLFRGVVTVSIFPRFEGPVEVNLRGHGDFPSGSLSQSKDRQGRRDGLSKRTNPTKALFHRLCPYPTSRPSCAGKRTAQEIDKAAD